MEIEQYDVKTLVFIFLSVLVLVLIPLFREPSFIGNVIINEKTDTITINKTFNEGHHEIKVKISNVRSIKANGHFNGTGYAYAYIIYNDSSPALIIFDTRKLESLQTMITARAVENVGNVTNTTSTANEENINLSSLNTSGGGFKNLSTSSSNGNLTTNINEINMSSTEAQQNKTAQATNQTTNKTYEKKEKKGKGKEEEKKGKEEKVKSKNIEIISECIDTCAIALDNVTNIYVVVVNGTLSLDNFYYSYLIEKNKPPVLKEQFSNYTVVVNTTLELPLSQYFYDPDGDSLLFDYKTIKTFDVIIKNGVAYITPHNIGNYTFYFYAMDEKEVVKSNEFIISVVTSIALNINQTHNLTYNETTNITTNGTNITLNISNNLTSLLQFGNLLSYLSNVDTNSICLPSSSRRCIRCGDTIGGDIQLLSPITCPEIYFDNVNLYCNNSPIIATYDIWNFRSTFLLNNSFTMNKSFVLEPDPYAFVYLPINSKGIEKLSFNVSFTGNSQQLAVLLSYNNTEELFCNNNFYPDCKVIDNFDIDVNPDFYVRGIAIIASSNSTSQIQIYNVSLFTSSKIYVKGNSSFVNCYYNASSLFVEGNLTNKKILYIYPIGKKQDLNLTIYIDNKTTTYFGKAFTLLLPELVQEGSSIKRPNIMGKIEGSNIMPLSVNISRVMLNSSNYRPLIVPCKGSIKIKYRGDLLAIIDKEGNFWIKGNVKRKNVCEGLKVCFNYSSDNMSKLIMGFDLDGNLYLPDNATINENVTFLSSAGRHEVLVKNNNSVVMLANTSGIYLRGHLIKRKGGEIYEECEK